MNRINLLKKTLTFVCGLFIVAIGVAFSVKSNLGVSPVSCIPYIYSLKTPLTIGQLTILMNALFVVLQIIILRRKYQWFQLVQLPAVIAFGYFIDLAMVLVSGLHVSSYGGQIFWCLASCIVIGFGVFLEVKSGLTYLPGEGLAMAVSKTFGTDFGKIKVGLDSSMVALGIVSSLVLTHKLLGIREGTIAAAVLVGLLVRFFSSKLPMIDTWLNKNAREEDSDDDINGDLIPEI